MNGSPNQQFLSAEHVTQKMCAEACRYIHELSTQRILILSLLGGAFITMGALFSILLSTGIETRGVQLLLQGVGFSAGFFFVILSGSILFTEVNVVLPASALHLKRSFVFRHAIQFWALAWLGNVLGAFIVGWVLHFSHHYPAEHYELLEKVIAKKMQYQIAGDISAWFQIVISGMFGNWMVGMAAFFAVMGQTIIGKYIPVLLAVTLFVAANLQHSPANMAYFSMVMPTGEGPGWIAAFAWNLIPAGIGNILGGSLLVALPLWYALRPTENE
jgi:formate transporter